MTVVHRDAELLEEISSLEGYIASNWLRRVRDRRGGLHPLYAWPNFKRLGKRLGKRMKLPGLIAALEPDALEAFVAAGTLTLEDESFDAEDVEVLREAQEGTEALSNRFVSIDMDLEITPELAAEGLAREVVNRIQRARKEMDLNVADRIEVSFRDADLRDAVETHADYIAGETPPRRSRSARREKTFTVKVDEREFEFSIAFAGA